MSLNGHESIRSILVSGAPEAPRIREHADPSGDEADDERDVVDADALGPPSSRKFPRDHDGCGKRRGEPIRKYAPRQVRVLPRRRSRRVWSSRPKPDGLHKRIHAALVVCTEVATLGCLA
jgi:hypothetical protein